MDAAGQLRALRKGLNLQPDAIEIGKLFPMFAPASFFKLGNWPGPFVLPGAEGVGVTWAVDLPGGGMRYMDRSMREHWESNGVDWKAAALANLESASRERLYTHGLGRLNGGGVFAVAMMHTDGWGPSRLLLGEALRQVFPEGYRVAVPEMSCGFAISRKLDEKEEASVKDMVAKCFGGTRPLAPGIFEPQEILPNWAGV